MTIPWYELAILELETNSQQFRDLWEANWHSNERQLAAIALTVRSILKILSAIDDIPLEKRQSCWLRIVSATSPLSYRLHGADQALYHLYAAAPSAG